MNTSFQNRLLIGLQGNEHNECSDSVISKASGKDSENSELVSSRPCKIDDVAPKIVTLIHNGGLSDVQLLDRVCVLCKINITIKDQLLLTLVNNPESCIDKISHIVVMHNEDEYDKYIHQLQKWIFSADASEVKFDIRMLVSSKDYEKNKDFYDNLGEWASQSIDGDERLLAADTIIRVYKKSHSDLDLSHLQLTTLPSVIKDLSSVKTVNIKNNKFTVFPECLYNNHFSKINILGNSLHILTPGMKKIILAGQCKILSDQVIIDHSKELQEFYNINRSYEEAFLPDRINVQHTNQLNGLVIKQLKDAHMEKSTSHTQYDFKYAVHKFSLAGNTNVSNTKVRSFLLEDDQINIIGCSSNNFLMANNHPCLPHVLKFMYENVNMLVHLVARSETNVLVFLKNCAGNDEYSPTQVKSMPIKDYTSPRLEQYKVILQALSQVRDLVISNRPKAMMIACGVGEGRTGSFMALLKVFGKFKQLSPQGKKSFDTDQTSPVERHDGIFKRLSNEFRTTKFIADTVNELRREEEYRLDSGISVETIEQFMSLELMHLMLVINARIQDDASITVEQILEWVYNSNNKVTKNFIMEFGDIYYTKQDDNILTEADMLQASEKHLLETIRTIDTII